MGRRGKKQCYRQPVGTLRKEVQDEEEEEDWLFGGDSLLSFAGTFLLSPSVCLSAHHFVPVCMYL